MKLTSKISIVMSVYNGEKNILIKTYKNFEFIIINYGSIDKNLDIIKKYKNQDERIKKSKGNYIVRIDADDICLPNRLEEQLNFNEKKFIRVMYFIDSTF